MDILAFYRDKIDPIHFKAMEASVYLREVFQEGKDVTELKSDIIKKYGTQGKNITNMCSAGYFEGYIREVYDEMSSDMDFKMNDFTKYFNVLVTTSPFAIFVHKEMGEDELSGLILHKIASHQKYGVSFLAIHGIGRTNVRKIKKIVVELDEKDEFTINKQQNKNIILVKITF